MGDPRQSPSPESSQGPRRQSFRREPPRQGQSFRCQFPGDDPPGPEPKGAVPNCPKYNLSKGVWVGSGNPPVQVTTLNSPGDNPPEYRRPWTIPQEIRLQETSAQETSPIGDTPRHPSQEAIPLETASRGQSPSRQSPSRVGDNPQDTIPQGTIP